MQDKILSAEELAGYMRVKEKSIIKMAQCGELPAFKVGEEWRFNWATIDRYMQGHVFDASDEDLDVILSTKEYLIPFSRLTNESIIELDLKAKNKKQVISELARLSAAAGLTPSYDGLYIAMEDREKLLSTAVGRGVAIPHPRYPDQLTFREPHIVIARSMDGVDFDSPDGKRIHLFFMPCAQSQFVHVRLLAKISKLLHIPNVIERLMRVEKASDIIQILMAFEQQHMLPSTKSGIVQKVIDEQEGNG